MFALAAVCTADRELDTRSRRGMARNYPFPPVLSIETTPDLCHFPFGSGCYVIVHGLATVEAASRRFLPTYKPQKPPSNAAGRRVYWPVNSYRITPNHPARS